MLMKVDRSAKTTKGPFSDKLRFGLAAILIALFAVLLWLVTIRGVLPADAFDDIMKAGF